MGYSQPNKRVKSAAILLAVFVILTSLTPVFAVEKPDLGDDAAAAVEPSPQEESKQAKTQRAKAKNGMPAVDLSTGEFIDPSKKEKVPEDKKTDGSEPETNALMAGGQDVSSVNVPSAVVQRAPNIDENSGAYVYEYSITVPPGRNGLQPDLKLKYNSQENNDVNLFGYGWTLNIPYIERINKKGTDQLYTQNYFSSSLTGELIDLGSGSYGSKVENGEFLIYTLASDVWTVKDKVGTVYKFGTNAAERQDDPGDSTKIFKWMLQEVRDANDNYIKYTYTKDDGQIYPSSIVYTGNNTTDGIFAVNFVISTRTDVIKSYKTAFLVRSNYRITEINTTVSGTWYRKYTLAYTTGDNGLRSMLASITESGRDDSLNTTTLPATTFTYQTSTAGWDLDNSTYTAPELILEWRNFLDLNQDSLVDIIKSYEEPAGTINKKSYLNNGNKTWTNNTGLEAPILFEKRETRKCNIEQVFDQGVRIFDFNGDQYPDILKGGDRVGTTSLYDAYMSSGSAWTQNTSWNPIIAFTQLPYPSCQHGTANEDYSARVLDLNSDGLPDITRQEGNYYGTQLNTGTGFGSVISTWNMPVDIDAPYAQNVDINNDGLPDILYSQWDGFWAQYFEYAYLNTGTGSWSSNTNLITPLHFTPSGNSDNGVRFVDVNGDGIVDTVVDLSTPWDTRLGKGNGWGYANSNWNLPATGLKDGSLHAADLNEDGLVDFIKTINSSPMETRVYLHRGVQPDLLSRITYPTGGYVDLTYQNTAKYRDGSNNLLNPNLPFNLTTVKTITNNDGNGLNSTLTYSYEGGKYFYNNAFDRRLAGFAQIKQTDSAGNVIIYYYHQGNSSNSSQGEYNDEQWKINKPYRVEVANSSGSIYSKTIYKWDSYDLGIGRKFVKLAQALTMTYDGDSSHKDKAETYTYSNTTGNLTQRIEKGEVTGSDNGIFTDTGTDAFTTDYSYVTTTSPNFIGLPSQITIINSSSTKVKESKFYYDAQSAGIATKGNLTKKEDWKSGTTYVNIQKTYNSTYGTLASDIDQRGKTTTYTNDSNNLYPATVTNPLSQATSFTYDYTSGKVKQKTDPNTRVFQSVYDGLDRVLEEKQPDYTTPSTLVTRTAYAYTDTPGAVSVRKTDSLDGSTARETYQYFDGLGRVIQQRIEAEGANYEVTDKAYNNRGLLDKESLPYFSTGPSKTTPTSTMSLYNSYTYDPMGRVVTSVNATGTTTNTYADWKLTITDVNSKTKDLYKDAYGNLVRVDEHNGASTYSTYYTYNYLGNLTKITDALSNIRNFTYDGLGRRLTAQDLHDPADTIYFGTWKYTYDNAGNLTQVVDPKSQTINYTYDYINRVRTENYTGLTGTEVTYTYDSGTDGKGHLTKITTGTLTQTNTYNPLGGLKSESKVINSVTYLTNYEYDRLGNQTLITNPDSSKVKYNYNSAGLLESVQRKETTDGSYINVVSNFDYSPMGQPTTISYANGATTTNSYDATKLYRLSTKVTTIAGGSPAQDLTYTYDNVGNITRIVDASATATSKTANYTYDDLYRLTSATITNVASGQSTYTHTYTYDAIGNILTRTDASGTYSYAGNTGSNYANPHAATSIGSVNYTYDKNGNLLTETGGLSNTWNYNNKLTQTVKGGVTSTYAYDHEGQRVKLANGIATTIYPNSNFNIDGTIPVKHINAGGQLVATVKGTGSGAAVFAVHTDHLTGSNVVTNSSGTQEELMDYYPYGNIRLDQKAGSFNEQRKYAGSEYDTDTGLNYMNARYQNPAIGRFVSQDPVFLAIGDNGRIKQLTDQELQVILADPQNLNSYAYGRNNPLSYQDPTGQWSVNIFAVLPNSWQLGIGNAANNAYINNAVARYALDHPYQAGAAIGVLGGAAITGGVVVAGGTITCGILCGSAAVTTTATVGPVVASQANKVTNLLNGAQSIILNASQRQSISGGIQNPILRNIFNSLYQGRDKLPGGTAGAIRYEQATGNLLSPAGHLQKGQTTINGLNKILNNPNVSQGDKGVAQMLRDQLDNAIKGK